MRAVLVAWPAFSPENLFGGTTFEDILGGLGFDFGEPNDRFFGHRARPRCGENIESTSRSRWNGSSAMAPVPRQAQRRATAQSAGEPEDLCAPTQGQADKITICPECVGRGTVIEKPCPECGQGRNSPRRSVDRSHSIGWRKRRPLRTANDPRFERDGRGLYRLETIDVVDAVLGASIDVPTLEGQITCRDLTRFDVLAARKGTSAPW